MHKTVGVIAGSYDSVTLGHGWLFRTAAQLVNELHVVVGVNPSKRYMLPDEKRMELVNTVVKLELPEEAQVRTKLHFLSDDLTAQFADRLGATHLVRGIRNSQDLFFEENIAGVNHKIRPHIQTVYLMTPPDLACVSSSAVRELLGKPGWEDNLKAFVHPPVLRELAELPCAWRPR